MEHCSISLKPELSDVEINALCSILKSGSLSGAHLEIGTAAGGTLVEMMKCYSDEKRPPFHVVDLMKYFPRQKDTVEKNIEKDGLNIADVTFHVGKSEDIFLQCMASKMTYDFIFIDAAHKINYVTKDLRWSRMLNVNGFLCLHDYHEKDISVPVDLFLSHHKNYKKIGLYDILIVLQKVSVSSRPEVGFSDYIIGIILGPIFNWRRCFMMFFR